MLLSMNDVTLSLPGSAGMVDILRGVSLSLPKGKSVAVVGPSGSGKTSLMMICAGLLKATSGTLIFDGADITHHSEGEMAGLRRDRMGIVFQNFHLIPTMTALENVAIPLELAGVPAASERAKEALVSVQLGHRLTHYPSQLSGGEQQRVAIARALAMKPALILADEPTGNLDQDTGSSIMTLLFERVKDHSATLMLITHDPALAAMCDHTIHIKDGKVLA
ncbi:MAG: ABC transporter ATP-binding protein [Alphaproteobacteria bacterium]|nr:ABC transporter ATP-binding protein [Alphaproteobacteria bacterium]